jgi:hypothetical protein
MDTSDFDPMVFRPPRLRWGLQLAIGLPLSSLLLLPTLFAAWLVWAPHVVELRIDAGELHITTAPAPLSRQRTIDLADIVNVEEARLGRGHRTAGTALPGYCVGNFRYDDLGMVWQATDCSRDVLVLRRENDKPIVLTPPRTDRFLTALDTGGGYEGRQDPPATGAGWLFIKLLVLLAPLAGLLVPAIFLVAPGRLRYRVEPGALAVVTMLGTRRFATTGCTARHHRPKIGLRLWGTGAPGYFTGLYRLDGENARIYATSVKEGVLIEGAGVRVFVNPEDETAFLEAMHTMGGATT